MNTRDEGDVGRVYSGSVVTAELYQQALRDAGIDSKVVGLDLTASFKGLQRNFDTSQ